MKYYLTQILIILVFLLQGITSYSQSWVSLDDTMDKKDLTIRVLRSDAFVHKVKMTIHGFYDNKVTIDGHEYHKIFMNEGSGLNSVGEPQLPTIAQLIAIPEGASYKISVVEEKWKDIEIGVVFPAQKDSKGRKPELPFTIAQRTYQQKVYCPFIVSNVLEQNWRHIRNVSFNICPFRYYPKDNKLSVLTEFVLQVDFLGISDNSLVGSNDLQDAIKWQMFDNDIKDFPVKKQIKKTEASNNDYDYLIIVGNLPSILNSQALKDFTKWKALKGYKTQVVSTTTTGTSSDAIKNYIAQEYHNNGIGYVLLIGDQDKIPLKVLHYIGGDTVRSDYWYGCLEGGENDYFAEIPIGRFSTNSLADFQNMVNKTISYEKKYSGNYKKTLLVAHKEDAPGKYQGCCNEIKTSHYSDLSFFTAYGASANQTTGGDDAQNADVIDYINSKMHIVNYRGHGIPNSWGFVSPYDSQNGWNTSLELFQSDLSNYIDSCSIYFNVCCQTGNIEEEPCFMEVFTRSQKCAIVCLAATEDIWTLPAHTYDKKLFSNMLVNDVCHIGNLNMTAHISTINYFSSSTNAIYNALSFLCGGDPTLEIWTGTPCSYSNVSIVRSINLITVSSSSFNLNDKVSIVSETGSLIGKYNVTGNTCTFPVPSGNFYISINRHNYYPHFTYYCTSNYIQNQTIDVNSYYDSTPLNIGYDVTNTEPYGNVLIKSGSKLTIKNGNGSVSIKNGFGCEKGAELNIE